MRKEFHAFKIDAEVYKVFHDKYGKKSGERIRQLIAEDLEQ